MTKSVSFFTRLGYGQFPYIIIREQAGMYRQIPIHFNNEELNTKDGIYVKLESKDSYENIEFNCVETLKEFLLQNKSPYSHIKSESNWIFIGKNQREGCVVFNPEQAVYLNYQGETINTSNTIPWGGTLISISDHIIQSNDRHFNLQEDSF